MILYLAIAAVAVAGLGVLTRSRFLVAVAAALAVPFTLYLTGAPRVRGVAWLLPLPLIAAAWLIRSPRAVPAGLVALFSVGVLAFEMMLFGAFR